MFEKDFDILKIQEDYYKILQSFEFNENNLSFLEIKSFLEELEIFWRENIKKILLFLDNLDGNNTVFLGGGLYLNLENKEDYFFKTFGGKHIVFDPLYKFTDLIHFNNDVFISNAFLNSYKNMMQLSNYPSSSFIILPLNLILEYTGLNSYIDNLTLSFLNNIFNLKMNSIEEIIKHYSNYEDINKIFFREFNELFIYEPDDQNLSLSERIDKYSISNEKNKVNKIFQFIFEQLTQYFCILSLYESYNIIPIIIYTRAYLNFCTISLRIFEDEEFKNLLNTVIITKIFYKIFIENPPKISLGEYLKIIDEKNFINSLKNIINEENNIISNFKYVHNIISESYRNLDIT